MNSVLFMLALAACILAPNNPVMLVILFIMACLRVWRSDALETDNSGGGDSDCSIHSEDLPRNCDLI